MTTTQTPFNVKAWKLHSNAEFVYATYYLMHRGGSNARPPSTTAVGRNLPAHRRDYIERMVDAAIDNA